jgi:hypothetical protein
MSFDSIFNLAQSNILYENAGKHNGTKLATFGTFELITQRKVRKEEANPSFQVSFCCNWLKVVMAMVKSSF